MRVIDGFDHTAGYVKLFCTRQGLSFFDNETFNPNKPVTCEKCLNAAVQELDKFKLEARCRLNKAVAYKEAVKTKDYEKALAIEHDSWLNYMDQPADQVNK